MGGGVYFDLEIPGRICRSSGPFVAVDTSRFLRSGPYDTPRLVEHHHLGCARSAAVLSYYTYAPPQANPGIPDSSCPRTKVYCRIGSSFNIPSLPPLLLFFFRLPSWIECVVLATNEHPVWARRHPLKVDKESVSLRLVRIYTSGGQDALFSLSVLL